MRVPAYPEQRLGHGIAAETPVLPVIFLIQYVEQPFFTRKISDFALPRSVQQSLYDSYWNTVLHSTIYTCLYVENFFIAFEEDRFLALVHRRLYLSAWE